MKFLTLVFVCIAFLSGCSFSTKDATKDIKPIKNKNEIKEICIYQPETSILDYGDAGKVISNKLDSLNITNKLVTADSLKKCEFSLSYIVKKAGIPPYLANAFFVVSKGSEEIGYAKYFYSVSGFTITGERSKGTDEKINELLSSLFEAN
ncbi:hypothetical protein RHO12_03215 [Orbus sturtevantii]|uniref:hypothetical protein n=1 Tax=Orbus sturtevantii TaxID=3074109 RepID=UPI00370DCBAF